MEITKQDFEAYEKIRTSGETNMFQLNNVITLSDGQLNKEKIIAIMKDYTHWVAKYPGVRK